MARMSCLRSWRPALGLAVLGLLLCGLSLCRRAPEPPKPAASVEQAPHPVTVVDEPDVPEVEDTSRPDYIPLVDSSLFQFGDSEAVLVDTSPEGTTRLGDSIEFHHPVELFARKWTEVNEFRWEDIGQGLRVGRFLKGRYAGFHLIYTTLDTGEQYKGGPGDVEPPPTVCYLRFGLRDSTLVYFARISHNPRRCNVKTFGKLGYRLRRDTGFSVPILTYPARLTGPGSGQVLAFEGERLGQVGSDSLRRVFTDSVYGPVYETYDRGTWDEFQVGRPDGTILAFSHNPGQAGEDIRWSSGGATFVNDYGPSIYRCIRYGQYEIARGIADSELAVAGTVDGRRDVYELKDEASPRLRGFYREYEQGLGYCGYWDGPCDDTAPRPVPVIYEDFLRSHPLVYWRDAFDRLIPLAKTEFAAPCLAEPIIYLYAQTETVVDIRLGSIVKLHKTSPPYLGKWTVRTGPSGRLVDLRTGQKRRWLFWEGTSCFVPHCQTGFVVRQDSVEQFFRTTLSRLSLQGREIDDFLKAWLPDFTGAPYFFVGFYDQSLIERMAPLEIEPKPDVLIRVLMEWYPLQERRKVKPPVFGPVKQRRGLTVVEWGGIL